MKTTQKLWIGIAVLVFLAPLGIMAPAYFKAGAAWGEWGSDEIQKLAGYVPRGLETLSGIWHAPFPDYAFKGWEQKGLLGLSVSYVASAVIGIALIVVIIFLIKKFIDDK